MAESGSPDRAGSWERNLERTVEVLPFALLAFSTVASLIQPDQGWGDRLVTLALVALAAAWVLGMYTLRPRRWRSRTGPMVVYFVGLLTLATVLTARSWPFVAFAVTGLVVAFIRAPDRPRLPRGVRHLGGHLHGAGRVPRAHRGRGLRLGVHHRPPDGPERVLQLHRDQADGGGQATAGTAGPPRGRHGGERRAARPAADPGPRGRHARRAPAHGHRDARHPGPGADGHHHPAGGHRTGRRAPRAVAPPPRPGPRPGQDQPDRGPPVGAGPAARAAGGGQPAAGAGRAGQPLVGDLGGGAELRHHRGAAAAARRAGDDPVPSGPGGAGECGQARRGVQGRADAVVHRPGGAAGRARRRGRLRRRTGRR